MLTQLYSLIAFAMLAGFTLTVSGFQHIDFDQSWESLSSRDVAESSSAIRDFLAEPARAIMFFQKKLKPISFEEGECEKLIKELGSDDSLKWESAFNELQYRDPRLFDSNFMNLIELAPNLDAKRRLIAILVGDSLDGEMIVSIDEDTEIVMLGGPFGNFKCGKHTRFIETRVNLLATPHHGGAKQLEWERTIRALYILKTFDNELATDTISVVASGNEIARPVKVAKQLLGSE